MIKIKDITGLSTSRLAQEVQNFVNNELNGDYESIDFVSTTCAMVTYKHKEAKKVSKKKTTKRKASKKNESPIELL